LFQKLIDDRELLKSKQKALMMVRPDLVYGYGSPLEPDPAFNSRIADHVLKESLIVRCKRKRGERERELHLSVYEFLWVM